MLDIDERQLAANRQRLKGHAAARVLTSESDGMGVTQLAHELGIGKSSVHLLLSTLAQDEFVGRRPDGRYQFGLGWSTWAGGPSACWS